MTSLFDILPSRGILQRRALDIVTSHSGYTKYHNAHTYLIRRGREGALIIFYLFDLILYVLSTIFPLSSLVETVLS